MPPLLLVLSFFCQFANAVKPIIKQYYFSVRGESIMKRTSSFTETDTDPEGCSTPPGEYETATKVKGYKLKLAHMCWLFTFQKKMCTVQRSVYDYGYAEAINNWQYVGGSTPTFADVSALDAECEHVLGEGWQAWNAELWEEWHWVFQIPSGRHIL